MFRECVCFIIDYLNIIIIIEHKIKEWYYSLDQMKIFGVFWSFHLGLL